MRHKVYGNQLGRPTNQAKALYRSLVAELLKHGHIETNLAKAKAVVKTVDQLINFAKRNNVAARREVDKILGQNKIADKLFSEIAPRYGNRVSGYTRIIKLGPRFADTAQRVYFELVEGTEPVAKPAEPKAEEKSVETKAQPKKAATKKPKSPKKSK